MEKIFLSGGQLVELFKPKELVTLSSLQGALFASGGLNAPRVDETVYPFGTDVFSDRTEAVFTVLEQGLFGTFIDEDEANDLALWDSKLGKVVYVRSSSARRVVCC